MHLMDSENYQQGSPRQSQTINISGSQDHPAKTVIPRSCHASSPTRKDNYAGKRSVAKEEEVTQGLTGLTPSPGTPK